MEKKSIEQAVNDLFKGGTTGTGEEELLRLASKYSMQLSAQQIKCLLYIKYWANMTGDPVQKMTLDEFVQLWLAWKEYNNSAGFIMRIIGDISMRRFITEQSFKVDIKK